MCVELVNVLDTTQWTVKHIKSNLRNKQIEAFELRVIFKTIGTQQISSLINISIQIRSK